MTRKWRFLRREVTKTIPRKTGIIIQHRVWLLLFFLSWVLYFCPRFFTTQDYGTWNYHTWFFRVQPFRCLKQLMVWIENGNVSKFHKRKGISAYLFCLKVNLALYVAKYERGIRFWNRVLNLVQRPWVDWDFWKSLLRLLSGPRRTLPSIPSTPFYLICSPDIAVVLLF